MGCGSSTNNSNTLELKPEPGADRLSLAKITKAIGKNPNLRVLQIEGHELETIPEAVFALQDLEELVIADGELKSVDPRIGTLKNLKKLELFSNKIASIPEELFSLPNLEEINLFSNLIKKIPDNINGCTSLRVLCLGSNKFMQLPAIDNLTNLEELKFQWGTTSIAHGSWEALPLKTLMCGGCRLSSLPKLPATLESVDVNKNFLSSLDGIEECKNLEEFMANDNEFETIPAVFQPSLVLFKMQNNKLKAIPSEIGQAQQLKCLFLTGNQIEQVPEEINTLSNLVRVDMKKNPVYENGSLEKLKENTLANPDGRYF